MFDKTRRMFENAYYDFVELNWKYFGKILVVIVPAVLWTVTYYIIKWIYAGAEAFNTIGGDAIESFLKD